MTQPELSSVRADRPHPTHTHLQTLDGEIDDNIQAMISLDQQERLKELANEMAVA